MSLPFSEILSLIWEGLATGGGDAAAADELITSELKYLTIHMRITII